MKILFIADPNSIHDIRWINFFSEQAGVSCFILPRRSHYMHFDPATTELHRHVVVLNPLRDPSAVRPLRNLFELLKIRRTVKRLAIDILHILYAEPNALWANGKWLFRKPVVLTTRGTDVLKTIPGFFFRRDFLGVAVASQYRRALKKFDQITCTSQSQVETLSRLGINGGVALVRTGVNIKALHRSQVSKRHCVPTEKPLVFMPRSMKPLYNHEFTLKSIAMLSEAIRKKYAFVFINNAGHESAYFKEIRREASATEAEIHFLPELKHQQLIEVLRHASLVVMNPKSDGSPVTAMEAMACRKPVILPPLQYDPEVFGGAFIFETWSPVELKDLMERVLQMVPDDLAKITDRNFNAVCSKGNSEIEMKKVEGIYRRLVSDDVNR